MSHDRERRNAVRPRAFGYPTSSGNIGGAFERALTRVKAVLQGVSRKPHARQ